MFLFLSTIKHAKTLFVILDSKMLQYILQILFLFYGDAGAMLPVLRLTSGLA